MGWDNFIGTNAYLKMASQTTYALHTGILGWLDTALPY